MPPTLAHATTTKATVGGVGGRISNPILRLVSYETAAENCFVWIAAVCLTLRQHGQERDRETGSSKLCSHTNPCMQSVRIIAGLLTTAPADLIFYEPVYSPGDEQNAVAARAFVVGCCGSHPRLRR